MMRTIVFQLTRPLRGATQDNEINPDNPDISTHTPLAGRDPAETTINSGTNEFQLTRPLRGATIYI